MDNHPSDSLHPVDSLEGRQVIDSDMPGLMRLYVWEIPADSVADVATHCTDRLDHGAYKLALPKRPGLTNDRPCVSVGSRDPRIKLKYLAQAIEQSGDLRGMKITVVSEKNERIFDSSHLQNTYSSEQVVWEGFVTASELKALFAHAGCRLFPPLDEKRGLSSPGAMYCELTVLGSSRTSVVESCGDAALYCDATSDTVLRERHQTKGPMHEREFKWERSTQSLPEILHEQENDHFPQKRSDRTNHEAGRRRVLRMLAALAGATLHPALARSTGSSPRPAGGRRITDMIGSNGWPGSTDDIAVWHEMGLTWGRDVVGPGQPHSSNDPMRVDKTMPVNTDLPPILIRNNKNGIRSLLLLAYTPVWNATVPGDTKSAPVDVDAWKRYVDAVVRKYSAPPYNLRHFQIWNEAAGRLSGGLPQSTFWHGPKSDADEKHPGTYERAMQDYVDRIHIPAARIIRSYHAYVVYGGWPDQGGMDNYIKWLEYRSPVFKERMLDWVDYLDTHYLPVKDLDPLYENYVKQGPARGIWQTEIGYTYMENPHYLPRYFFDFAVWALKRNWNDPDKYVSMIYHWDGAQPFILTHPGPPKRTFNPSGRSLIVLRQTVNGTLSSFTAPLQFSDGANGSALRSGNDIVLQVRAAPGWRTVTTTGTSPASSSRTDVQMIDALTGAVSTRDDVALTWDGDSMKIRFKIPDQVNGEASKPPMHLAYIVVRA